MSENLTLTGMVLSSVPMGEYDRRVVLLTKEKGRISAFVKGAMRPKSTLRAASDLFCFGQYEAFKGRSAYTIIGAKVENYFRELASDYSLTCYGCYFLELADNFTQENDDCTEQLSLLYLSLKALISPSLDNRLVRRIYELRTLTIYGVAPNVFTCVSCGRDEDLCDFSMRERGVLCARCAKGCAGEYQRGYKAAGESPGAAAYAGEYSLNRSAVYTMKYIITSPVEKLYSFKVSEEVLEMISRIISDYLDMYTDRKIKSLKFLQ